MPHASALRTRVLHGLRLKGFAQADALAAFLDEPEASVASVLEQARDGGLAVHRDGRLAGWTLTTAGRAENERLVAEELDTLGLRDEVRWAYDRFIALNAELLALCTRWQVRPLDGEQVLNDHRDPAYDQAVLDDLHRLDDQVRPICAELAGHLDRFGLHAPRFAAALARLDAGELDWFTKPIIDSYHTVWFELHEDLLVSLGLERAAEVAPR